MIPSPKSLVCVLAGLAFFSRHALAQEAVTAFIDVTVVPMDRERVVPRQTVLVQRGRIIALGPVAEIQVPTNAVRIAATGKFLMPGLADMHAHLTSDPENLTKYLAYGITTVREMLGRPEAVALRDQVARNAIVGPRIYLAGVAKEACPKEQALATCVAALKAAGFTMLKLYAQMPETLADFDTAVALARRAQLPVGGHVSPWVGLGPALEARFASIEHLWGYFELVTGAPASIQADILPPAMFRSTDSTRFRAAPALLDTAAWMQPGTPLDEGKLKAVVEATRQAGSWNVPTLVILEEMACAMQANTKSHLLPRLFRRITESGPQIVKALQDGGAGLLLGTDKSQNEFIYRELDLLVQSGLTPYQALATGTRNVAAYLGTQDSMGTVASGKVADLLLLDGNPLADIRQISGVAGVMAGEQWWGRAALDTLRVAAQQGSGAKVHYTPTSPAWGKPWCMR